MKKTLLIIFTLTFFSCNLTSESKDNWLNISNSQIENNIVSVNLLTRIENTDKIEYDFKILNNCSCKMFKDTLFILLNYNNGWQDYSTLGKVYNGNSEIYLTKTNDIDSRIIKISESQLTIDEFTDKILGLISLQYDTIIESSKVEIKVLGKFNCKIEEATQEWYKRTQLLPDGTRKYE